MTATGPLIAGVVFGVCVLAAWLVLAMRAPRLASRGLMAAVAVVTLLGFAGRFGWPWELFSNIRPQLILIAGLALGYALARGHWDAAVGAGAAAALNILAILPHAGLPPDPDAPGKPLTVVWLNVWQREDALDAAVRLADTVNADIVALAEFPPAEKRLPEMFPDYPHTIEGRGRNVRGELYATRVAVVSKYPLTRIPAATPDEKITIIAADVDLDGPDADGAPLRFIAAHPHSPGLPKHLRERDAVLSEIAALTGDDERFLIVGDLNVAPWSPSFRKLPGQRVGDPRLQSTWVTRMPGIGLPIDHALTGSDVTPRAHAVGPYIGSDHRPLIIDVAVAEAGND